MNIPVVTRASMAVGLVLVLVGCGASAPTPSAAPSAGIVTAAGTSSLAPATIKPSESAGVMANTIVVRSRSAEPPLKRLWSTTLATPKAGSNSAIATAPDGRVWVVSAFDGQLAVLDPSGRVIRMIGAQGSDPGRFDFVDSHDNVQGGVAFDGAGNALISDTFNSRIQVLDATGKVTGGWGSFGTGDGQFVGPVGVAVDGGGHVFVGDFSRNDIQEFATGGQFIRAYTDGIDYMHSQTSQVAVDSSHAVFTTVGTTIVKIGVGGSTTTVFDLSAFGVPDAVVVDKAGNLWVPIVTSSTLAAMNGPLVVLDPAGKVLHIWDLNGNLVSLDPNEDAVYVTSFKSAEITKYSLPTR